MMIVVKKHFLRHTQSSKFQIWIRIIAHVYLCGLWKYIRSFTFFFIQYVIISMFNSIFKSFMKTILMLDNIEDSLMLLNIIALKYTYSFYKYINTWFVLP